MGYMVFVVLLVDVGSVLLVEFNGFLFWDWDFGVVEKVDKVVDCGFCFFVCCIECIGGVVFFWYGDIGDYFDYVKEVVEGDDGVK